MGKFYTYVREESLLSQPLFDFFRKAGLITKNLREATGILVVGGDGAMLSAVDHFRKMEIPFCGLNFGHVGFLMSEPTDQALTEIAEGDTNSVSVRLLHAHTFDQNDRAVGSNPKPAFNDVYFERASSQAAHLRVTVDREIRFDPLICDGALVCTPAGSTAYNASAGGVILPIETGAMVLTGICPAIFHHWRSTPLASDTTVILEALETDERPVRFIRDGQEIRGAVKAIIYYSQQYVELKFAKSQNFREKVLRAQFL